MSSPLGDYLRSRRDASSPEGFGVRVGTRRRVPGLRRTEVAEMAGISVEYLIRIEQGRDRNPSIGVVNAIASALRLDVTERDHVRRLSKMTSGASCVTAVAQPGLEVRNQVRGLLSLLEPAAALVTNRLGDVLAHTRAFDALARPVGILDGPSPNLTRFVFADRRARSAFADWERMADEQAYDLLLAPPSSRSERLIDELTYVAGEELTQRLHRHRIPKGGMTTWRHPTAGDLRLNREVLELAPADGQQMVVLLPADDITTGALDRLGRVHGELRAVN